MKTTFPKAKPKVLFYRDEKNFVEEDFELELNFWLQKRKVVDYDTFHKIFIDVLNKHAPCKQKIFRANHKPYMTKILRKAIMKRSALENKYYKSK